METMLQRMQRLEPGRNAIFTAIETLESDEEIQQFYSELMALYPDVTPTNIGYILGYYGPETRRHWQELLPEVYHPVFGRRLDVTPEEAFEAGKQMGKQARGSSNQGVKRETD